MLVAARADPLHPARRAPRRADDRAAAGPARREARGDRLSRGRAAARAAGRVDGVRRPARCVDELDLARRRGRDRQRDRPERRRARRRSSTSITGRLRADRAATSSSTGESIKGLEPHQITQRGIARTFQTLRLFLNMTRARERDGGGLRPHEGRRRSARCCARPGMRREEREIRALAEERLAFFGERLMGYRWDQPAYSLSYANRRRLEIARATATNPRLLLLDEPAAGMNPKETHEITELIGKLRTEGGYTILVIEHDMHVVEGISDRVVALDHGVKIAEGTFEAGRDRPAGRRGVPRHAAGWRASERRRRPAPLLQLEGINTYYGQIHILQDVEPRRRRGRARLPARRQRLRQVDDAEDDPRDRAAAHRARCVLDGEDVTRDADRAPDQARARDRAREPPAVRADDGAREPRDGRLPAAEGRPEGGVRARLRAVPAALRAPRAARRARSRAASSRWSRWAAR